MKNAAGHFGRSGKIPDEKQIIISDIVNYHSGQKDQVSKLIETELYFAFAKQFPEVKLLDDSESAAGISLGKTVFIKGSYQKKGTTTMLRLKALHGIRGEIIDQTSVEFDTKYRRRTLVAVLDIEATSLTHDQRKIFSDIFREALGETQAFDLASSAEVDKMDPDQVQKTTGCTRDACATIIGEQLGVDRVISSSFLKMDTDYYYISGKIIDIEDGSLVVTKTVKHIGNLRTIDASLKKLAIKLAGRPLTPVPVPLVVEKRPLPPNV